MKQNNRFDKSFGPVGSSAGLFMLIIGLIISFTSLFGLILVILGAFLGLTSTGTQIDFDNKRMKFSDSIFGIFRTGRWIPIEPGMKLGIRGQNVVWQAFSRSNRSLNIEDKCFMIILLNSDEQEIMPVKKAATLDSAQAELELLEKELGLELI